MMETMNSILTMCCSVLLLLAISGVSSTYISHDNTQVSDKDNTIDQLEHVKRYGPAFKNDKDISRYLKIYGMEMMLWRCRNAIQPYWNWEPINFVELYCEAIGRMRRVAWYHNGKHIHLGWKGKSRRFNQLIVPHYGNGRYFSRWIDFRLKIYNATTADSGIYSFRVWSPSGHTEEQQIYVDISEKKRKKKKRKNSREGGRKRTQNSLERQLSDVHGRRSRNKNKNRREINKEHVSERK